MAPVLFDTSLYISALRRGSDATTGSSSLTGYGPLWLSSVVLEELYAGASDRDHKVIERLEWEFSRAERIVVPSLDDWTQAGKALSRLAKKYDYEQIGRGRLTNDALIALSAGRLGITVCTANERDFRKLAEFCPFLWRLASA